VSGGAGLERGYRRLLACYPRRFRDENGEELLAVLLASARDGQHRPGLIDSADLVRSGLGMRLRPDVSRSARQRWSDALAAYTVAGPVLGFLSTALLLLTLYIRHTRSVFPAPWPDLYLTLAVQAVIVALVMAGWRKTALAALVIALTCLFTGWIPLSATNILICLSVYPMAAAALIASPGARHGRQLMHWGHWAILLPAAAVQAWMFLPFGSRNSLLVVGVTVFVFLAFNRLGRGLRLSRHYRWLIIAAIYPIVFGVAVTDLDGGQLMNRIGYPAALLLLFAGPLLGTAAALATAIGTAISSAFGPHRRRII
jgi:hypothetical protein